MTEAITAKHALKDVPQVMIRKAVQDFLEEHKEELADFIVERMGLYTAKVFENPMSQRMGMVLERQDGFRRELRDLEFKVQGLCPECGEPVAGYVAPTGAFAPEMWATLRERGVDPSTGHKQTCSRRHHD